jgi:glycosyltransferase involved in cell wall biosynthesis
MCVDKFGPSQEVSIVLFIAGFGNGGAERVFLNLYQELVELGYDVRLVASTRKGKLASIVRDVEFLGSRFTLSSLFRYGAYIQKYRPTVVISTLASAIFISALSKRLFQRKAFAPTLICRIANVYQKPRSFLGYLQSKMQRFALSQADALVANSYATLNSVYSEISNDLRNLPAAVIGNPVLPNNYVHIRSAFKREAPVNLDGADREIHLVAIGRLVHQKRIDHAIEAFALIQRRYQNSKLTIVGDGPLKRQLVNLVNKYQLDKKVTFISFSSDVPRLLASADCMISVSRYEGFGSVFIEGLAYCPNLVAYKNQGGSDEILPSTKATLVEDGNLRAMADAILGVLDRPIQDRLCSDIYLNKFTAAEVGRQYIKFIDENSKRANSSI